MPPAALEDLRAEYQKLRVRASGITPQARGRRFNGWLAELLRSYGIEARADDRSVGEIDVAFGVGDVRYILEAKWTQSKADTGHLAKLQKRLRQRLRGTYGIFVSMAGYTDEALGDLLHGERLELILLDREHVEAMLAEEISPQELLAILRDEAAFHGRAYTPIATVRSLRRPSSAAWTEDRFESPRFQADPEPEETASRVPGWDPFQARRGNPSSGYVVFEGRQRIYWTVVALDLMLAALTCVAGIFGNGLWRLAAFAAFVVEITLTVKFWQMAMRPIRLEIGQAGIQGFFAKTNVWLPWELIDRVDIVRVDGNLAVVAWTRYATAYPPLSNAGVAAYYVPSFDAVSICPLGPLRAKRQEVARALQYYGQNRY